MARIRTQKGVAGRIDLNYHRRWHPYWRTRLALVLGCSALALGWFAYSSVRIDNGRLRLVDAIHNPGPVTDAHKQIEHNCAACHDGDNNLDGKPDNGYWLTVSDTACLKCHDGSMHHSNQKLAADRAEPSLASFEVAVADKTHPHGNVSAGCIQCHTEHKGHDALVGTSDALCVGCHTQISTAAADPAKVGYPHAVTKFAFIDGSDRTPHPAFTPPADAKPGRSAARTLGDEPTWTDTTPILFGHAMHLNTTNEKGFAAQGISAAESCVMCHSPVDSVRQNAEGVNPLPPYATGLDSGGWAGDQPYMKPVGFAQHCIGCHFHQNDLSPRGFRAAANLTASAADGKAVKGNYTPALQLRSVPHEDAAIVRDAVAGLIAPVLAGDTIKVKKPGPGEFTIDRATWAQAALPALVTQANNLKKWPAGAGELAKPEAKPAAAAKPAAGATKPATQTGKPAAAAPAVVDADVIVDYYTAFVLASSCTKCHTLEGQLPTLDPVKNAELRKTGQMLRTTPTGINGREPRRWFTASHFDHSAHRMVDCMSCHAAAATSGPKEDPTKGSLEVLTSDIDGAYPGIGKARRDAVKAWETEAGTATVSCVACHQDDHTPGVVTASNNCITCHSYHDPRLARPMDNPHHAAAKSAIGFKVFDAPATQPAADAAAATPAPAATQPQ